MASKPSISFVVPCFNEEQALPITVARLQEEGNGLVESGRIGDYTIYLIDDGSADDTWRVMNDLAAAGAPVHGIKLSRNHGHQHALYAGLMEAEGDALVSLDADLQDDISILGEMIDLFLAGKEIVFAVRDDRSTDSVFKRWTARAHYSLSGFLGINTIPDHADFRLMSRRAIEHLREYREGNLYLRGIVPLLGLDTARVYFKRAERVAGVTKYNLPRMLGLAVHGITSFSIAPLRLVSVVGMVVFVISVAMGFWALWGALFNDEAVPGWASTVIPMYLLGGLQLLALGIVGEYIGKAYIEVKNRPIYQIDKTVGHRDRPSSELRDSDPHGEHGGAASQRRHH